MGNKRLETPFIYIEEKEVGQELSPEGHQKKLSPEGHQKGWSRGRCDYIKKYTGSG